MSEGGDGGRIAERTSSRIRSRGGKITPKEDKIADIVFNAYTPELYSRGRFRLRRKTPKGVTISTSLAVAANFPFFETFWIFGFLKFNAFPRPLFSVAN